MKTQSKVLMAVSAFFVAFMFGKTLLAAPPAVDAPEKIIASRRIRNAAIVLTNDSGKLTPGENSFCVLFQTKETTSSVEVREVSVAFRLLVGRIEEKPITAQLSQEGVGRYCGRIDLGRQYYQPASYYAFVRYTENTGKKRSVRLSLTVR